MKKITILKIVSVAILVALASVLSLFDRYISSAFLSMFPTVLLIFPYFKIGIANIIILVIIYNFDFKYSLISVILKSCILGLFALNGLTSFIIGFSGTILSYFVMYFLKKASNKSYFMIFVSMAGGFSHSLGQIIASLTFYNALNINSFLLYSPLILTVGLISGVLIGLITFKLNDVIIKHNLLKTPSKSS